MRSWLRARDRIVVSKEIRRGAGNDMGKALGCVSNPQSHRWYRFCWCLEINLRLDVVSEELHGDEFIL